MAMANGNYYGYGGGPLYSGPQFDPGMVRNNLTSAKVALERKRMNGGHGANNLTRAKAVLRDLREYPMQDANANGVRWDPLANKPFVVDKARQPGMSTAAALGMKLSGTVPKGNIMPPSHDEAYRTKIMLEVLEQALKQKKKMGW